VGNIARALKFRSPFTLSQHISLNSAPPIFAQKRKICCMSGGKEARKKKLYTTTSCNGLRKNNMQWCYFKTNSVCLIFFFVFEKVIY
jgi:hypothetical protein